LPSEPSGAPLFTLFGSKLEAKKNSKKLRENSFAGLSYQVKLLHGQPVTLLKEGFQMSENQIAQSRFNKKFNRFVAIAVANGFAVEVTVDNTDYYESAFAVIKRFNGECKNFLDVVNAAEVIYLSSSYFYSTKRSSMTIQRTAIYESPVKLPASRVLSWFAVWSGKSISEIEKAVA
jgi:hypothetical protein